MYLRLCNLYLCNLCLKEYKNIVIMAKVKLLVISILCFSRNILKTFLVGHENLVLCGILVEGQGEWEIQTSDLWVSNSLGLI